MTPLARMNRISEDSLCIGCGLCQSLAGIARLEMVVTPEGNERPLPLDDLDAATVERIYQVCPGIRVEGLPEALIDDDSEIDPVWGALQSVVLAHASDPDVRFKAATGGVLTALAIHLLKSGQVDFILHARASTSQPTFGEAQLSFDEAGVLEGMGSRYGPTAPLLDIKGVLDRGRPFAFVAKPCDIAALRNYAKLDPRVERLCRVMMAPVCGGFMEPQGMRDFLARLGIDYRDVTALRYRGYGCPGATRIETADGAVREMNYLDMWGEDETAWSLPFRCKICPDGIGEAADIAAADTWPGGSPDREAQKSDPGSNAVVARSRAGRALLEAAERDGALTIERALTARDLDDYQPHQVKKKYAAWARLLGLRISGRLAPQTARLRLADLAREAGRSDNLWQARGTRRRVREGRTSQPTPRRA